MFILTQEPNEHYKTSRVQEGLIRKDTDAHPQVQPAYEKPRKEQQLPVQNASQDNNKKSTKMDSFNEDTNATGCSVATLPK